VSGPQGDDRAVPRNQRDDADDVRLKYLEARRNEHSFQGMVLARHVAEAVCSALEAELPEAVRKVYQAKDLSGRLGFLEDKARKKEIDVSRAVVAALRTLQAYGNYASHHEPGAHQPPQRATTSAMASLALVAQWFLGRDPERLSSQSTDLPLREPAPGKPGWIERRALVFGLDLDLRFVDGEKRFEVVSSDPAETQLGTLYALYGKIVEVCRVVCRVVLERETTLDPELMTLDQLSLLLSQLSELRPERVPRAVCASVEEVERRLASVHRAMQQGVSDAAPIVLESRQRSPAQDVVDWFRRDYLGQGWLERRWPVVVLVAVLVPAALWMSFQIGAGQGKSAENRSVKHALSSEFCNPAAPVSSSALCERLAPLPPIGSAKPGAPAPKPP
jgi:hypothetical protein